MSIVVWDGSLKVGVETIDAQHKQLFEVVNSLHRKVQRQGNWTDFYTTLDSLNYYVKYHFTTEERLLREHGYPELDDHIAEHDTFRERARSLENPDTSGEPSTLLLETLTFMLEWVVRHIQVEDRKYAAFLRQTGVTD